MTDNFNMNQPLPNAGLPPQSPQEPQSPPEDNEEYWRRQSNKVNGTITVDPDPSPNESAAPTPQQALMGAVEMHYVSNRTRALANLNQYMMNPVGVAEHPDVVGEVIKLIEIISHSDGMLETLKKLMS